MTKLVLDPDTLAVETFAALDAPAGADGTVRAHGTGWQDPSCGPTCHGSCYDPTCIESCTCPTFHDPTCGYDETCAFGC